MDTVLLSALEKAAFLKPTAHAPPAMFTPWCARTQRPTPPPNAGWTGRAAAAAWRTVKKPKSRIILVCWPSSRRWLIPAWQRTSGRPTRDCWESFASMAAQLKSRNRFAAPQTSCISGCATDRLIRIHPTAGLKRCRSARSASTLTHPNYSR